MRNEDQDSDDGGDNSADQDGAGHGVFHPSNDLVVAGVKKVKDLFDSGIDDLDGEDENNGDEEDSGFESGNIENIGADADEDGDNSVNTGVLLVSEQENNAVDGMTKTFEEFFVQRS